MSRTIIVAEAAGFCSGVKKAIHRAEALGKAYIFGSLIHNPQEVERLDRAGKKIVHSLDEVQNGPVLITAHGLEESKILEMKARGLEVIDTTCPLVVRIYQEGLRLQEMGLKVVILGDPHHVEVKGIASRMKDPLLANSVDDVEKIPRGLRVGVICQSTLLQENFALLVQALKSRCAEVVAVDTICRPTKHRQDSVKLLAKSAQVIVVIGGFNSSNTKKLKDMSVQLLGEASTHHIETAAQLEESWLKGRQVVGLTAGASTPDYLINQVIDRIRSFDPPGEKSTVVRQGEEEEA